MCQILMNVLREGFTESHANHHLYRWKLGSCGNTQTQVKKTTKLFILIFHHDLKLSMSRSGPLPGFPSKAYLLHQLATILDETTWILDGFASHISYYLHFLFLQCFIRAYVFPWCMFPCITHIEHCRTALDTITTSSLPDLPSQLQSPPSRMSSITPSHFIISSHPTTGGKQALYEVLLTTQADFRWGTLLPQRNML